MHDDDDSHRDRCWYYSIDPSGIGGCEVSIKGDQIVVTDDRFQSETYRFPIEQYFSVSVELEEATCRAFIERCLGADAIAEVDQEVKLRLMSPSWRPCAVSASEATSQQRTGGRRWWEFWK